MTRRGKKPSPLGEILENYFSRSGLNRFLSEQRVMNSWRRAVGKGIAEQTQPVRVQNRILQIRVSNSVWMQQLHFMKRMILTKIKEDSGGEYLDDLRFFIGEVAGGGENAEDGAGRKENDPKEWEELSAIEITRIRKEVESLSDPEMRRILENVFARSLAARKSSRGEAK